jgi:hypothetical protein
MAEFYFEEYVNNYEIDFYNDGTEEEKSYLNSKGILIYTYYKDGDKWCTRSSGITFNLIYMTSYSVLKVYLDYRFNMYMRKKKLEKIKNLTC